MRMSGYLAVKLFKQNYVYFITYINNITGKIPKYLFKHFDIMSEQFTIILNNVIHAVAKQEREKVGIGNDGKNNNATSPEELLKRNPIFTDLLVGDLNYYLKWDEKALGLFIWQAWDSANEEGKKRLEGAIEELSRMKLPRRFMKFVYAARMAKKLIEKEKKMLNIV